MTDAELAELSRLIVSTPTARTIAKAVKALAPKTQRRVAKPKHPIVTMPGALMRGRHTTAILKMMGITATIAATVDDYVSTAIHLARDEQWRKGIKIDIARNKHRLHRDRDCILALQEFLARVARHRPADVRNSSDALERTSDRLA